MVSQRRILPTLRQPFRYRCKDSPGFATSGGWRCPYGREVRINFSFASSYLISPSLTNIFGAIECSKTTVFEAMRNDLYSMLKMRPTDWDSWDSPRQPRGDNDETNLNIQIHNLWYGVYLLYINILVAGVSAHPHARVVLKNFDMHNLKSIYL